MQQAEASQPLATCHMAEESLLETLAPGMNASFPSQILSRQAIDILQ